MLSVEDATRAVVQRVPRSGSERVALAASVGRILAEDIAANRPLPGFDNSAMDGYAARSIDLPATLPVVGVVGAGDRAKQLRDKTALRIFTGAALPRGADTVVIQEDVTRNGDDVTLPASPIGDNIRRAGEDVAIGEIVLRAGTRVRAWDLAILAALGRAEVSVAKTPRVAILATGDELVDIDAEPGVGQLVASTRYALDALVREAGGEVIDLGIVRDDRMAIASALTRALECDVAITTGGVSVGDRDLVRAALVDAGVTPELWKVAIKPGKPFSFGLHGTSPVFGLPGNPVSSLVAFELFVRPALLAMQGATQVERPRVQVRIASAYRKQPGRAPYVRARVERDGDGFVAYPHARQGSAMLSALPTSNALVELVADRGDVGVGETAPALLLEIV